MFLLILQKKISTACHAISVQAQQGQSLHLLKDTFLLIFKIESYALHVMPFPFRLRS
jgi:hypothetical protein